MGTGLGWEQAGPPFVDRTLRATVGLAALLFGLLLVSHRSGDADLWGRYSLPFACLLVAYVPFLLSALWLAVRGGALLGVVRSVLSMRLFQVGCAVLSLPFLVSVWRYQQNRSGIDLIRAMAVGLAAATYVLGAVGVAGRSGVARLEAWLRNVALLFGSLLFTAAAASVLLAIRGSEEEDVVAPLELRATVQLMRTPNAEFV